MGSLLPPGEERLVAREQSLADLEVLAGTRAGALLVGEAGVGKSFLARALGRQLADRGAPVGATAALDPLRGRPLGALRPLVGGGPSGSADPVEWADGRLTDLYGGGLVLVDDVDQLDADSAAVLHRLTQRRAGRSAVWLLLTMRAGACPPSAVERLLTIGALEQLPVAPLAEDGVAALAENLLGGPLGEDAVAWIWEQSRGNPLFARELVRAAWQEGRWSHAAGSWTLVGRPDASARLQPLLESRIAGLVSPADQLADLLSLAGPLPPELIAALGMSAEIRALEAAGLVGIADGQVALAHVTFAEMLRARLTESDRKAWARRLLEASAGLDLTAGATVRITTLALSHGHELPATDLLTAATMALSTLDLATARDLAAAARSAAAVVEDGEATRTAVLLETQTRAMQGDPEARAELERTARHAPTPEERTAARVALAHVGVAQPDGPALVLRALGDDADDAAVETMRARALMRQNQWPDATAAAARALDLAATPEDWVEAAAIAALLHAWGADPATAVQLVRRGLDTLAAGVVVPPHAPIVLGQAGSLAALLRGELELARAFAELRVPDPPGSTFFRAHHQLRMGVLDVYQGSPDAEHRLTRAFSLLHEADPAEVRTWTLAFLARAQVQFGNTGAARETVRRARSFLNPGQPTAEVELLVAEAWVVASEGHATEAQRMLGRLSDSQAGAQVSAALVAVDLARCGGLEEAADRLTGVGEAVGSPVLATVEQLLRAGLELDVEGVSDAAAELLGQGMRAWAADLLAVAGDLAGQGGATLRARAQAVATASGGHRTPALRDTSTRLTPTQQRVAHLAARGLTNRQIGESLDISPRTAATHLHRAYRVLGVNDRDQLARLMP